MFSFIHADGTGDDEPSIEKLSALFDELRTADREHGDVYVVHDETGWGLSAHRDGRLVFEHLGGEGGPFHRIPVAKQQVLELWERLARGDVEGLLAEPWSAGYG